MRKTQNERLVEYLRACGSITAIQASNVLGITQLAARIIELQRQGYTIGKERITVTNRHGEKRRVVAYRLED